MLETGFHAVPPGHLATVVTYLEMRQALTRPERAGGFTLRRVERPGVAWYRDLFRRVGAEDWLWFSRLVIPEAELEAVLHDPLVEVWVLEAEGEEAGLLELDFRENGACELAFFGLLRGMIGNGAGRWLMNRAIEKAFRTGVERFHLHTCTMDSPQALGFYRRSGFTPLRQEVEVLPDPRVDGILPEEAAAQIPIYRG
ncbi:GNAT family N-acetyltransferase [Rhodobacteraceae bacterium D3-12]|nr:GNAT family N-acetyltransferase [Rhodobacteraceae bacterium D3-12]